jgi:hypothetical protein
MRNIAQAIGCALSPPDERSAVATCSRPHHQLGLVEPSDLTKFPASTDILGSYHLRLVGKA